MISCDSFTSSILRRTRRTMCHVILLPLILWHTAALACMPDRLDTAQELEQSLRCIKAMQADLQIILNNHVSILKSLSEDLDQLLDIESECWKIERTRQFNTRITDAMLRDCVIQTKRAAARWTNSGSLFHELIAKQNLDKDRLEALRLKHRQIENAIRLIQAR